MENIIKTSIKVSLRLPNKECSAFENEKADLTIYQYFNSDINDMNFALHIPTYIFNKLKDTSEEYLTTGNKKFTQILKSGVFKVLISDFEKICKDVILVHDRNVAQTEKYIAIKFLHNNTLERDSFNFASMGYKTSSAFQFFIVYYAFEKSNSLDRYRYKSNIYGGSNINSLSNNQKNREWYWFTPGTVEKYQLIKWTQEREDFLTQVQNKFIKVNEELDSFLGNIDDDKMNELMLNTKLLLQ